MGSYKGIDRGSFKVIYKGLGGLRGHKGLGRFRV